MPLSFKAIFILVFVIGFAFCTRGIGKIAANHDWLSPAAFMGYIFGVLALILFFAVVFNRRPAFISSDKEALIYLLAIIAIKFLVSFLYSFFKK